MCLLIVALLIESPADDALAQPADAQASFCFNIITTRRTAQLDGAILLNQCTGQTWLLTRMARQGGASGYRWNLLIADGLEINNSSPRPEVRIVRAPEYGEAGSYASEDRKVLHVPGTSVLRVRHIFGWWGFDTQHDE